MSNHLLSVSTFGISLLIVGGSAYGLFITHRPFSPDLISDGVHDRDSSWGSYLVHNRLSAESSTSTCDQTYGFLPCTTSVMGNLFLTVVYGYLMFFASKSLSDGCELLFEILEPGIVVGLLLPILRALSDAIIVLVSGIFGTTETAQSQVSVGMGMLAGSTVLLLTIKWGSCVVVGKCDLDNSNAVDAKDTKGSSLTESGVNTEIFTQYAARIMVVSVIPLLIPQILNSTLWRHIAVLIGFIASLLLLFAYSIYHVLRHDIQKKEIEYFKHKHVILLLGLLNQRIPGRLFREDGEPNIDCIKNLFSKIDANHDQRISYSELRALLIGIQFEEIDLDHTVNKIMNDFDTSGDSFIDEPEFVKGISGWLNKRKQILARKWIAAPEGDLFHIFHKDTKKDAANPRDEDVLSAEDSKWTYIKATLLLLLGTIIAAAFADPLVDAVDNFSDATSIPSFIISFIVLPLATGSRDAVSEIILASRDKRKTASLTFYEIYGSVTMHNVLNLPVFLALVYFRGLTWDFSSEVLVILIVSIVIGALASFRTHFPLWTSIPAILLYPFSLALFCVLHYYYGWS